MDEYLAEKLQLEAMEEKAYLDMLDRRGITAEETMTDKATQAPTTVPMLWLFRQILAR